MEHHLIVYITYLTNGGRGQPVIKCIYFLQLKERIAQYVWCSENSFSINESKLVGFGSDCASSIRDIHESLCSKICLDAPHLLDIHYIAHREALAANDALSHFLELKYIDEFAKKVYSWLRKSTKRHGELKELMESFQITKLEVLQIH